jgi:hypothetical protein
MVRAILLTAALVSVPAAAMAKDAEHSFQSVVPRGQVKRVTIDVPYGSFHIRNGSPSQIALSGVASRDYDGAKEREWAQKVVDDTSVEVYVSGSEAVVRRKFGPDADSWRARKFTGIDLRLDLPPGVDVVFETTAGDIDLAGSFGDVDIDLRAGEVDVRLPKPSVRELKASCRVGEVRAHLGNEIVTREGLLPGRTRYFNPEGRSRVNVHVTAGEVDVTLTN